MTRDHYWYWLCNLFGIGRLTISKLLEEYETPDNVYNEDDDIVMSLISSGRRYNITLSDYVNSKNVDNIIYSYERLNENGITFIHRESSLYPEKLRNIPDAPYGLYLKGTMPDSDKPGIAIIGSRNSTHYGREMARCFGRELARNGITIISGLARGIDGMGHRGAVEAGGYTLGVLGGGIDVVYPQENYDLFIEMEKSGGIISESNMGIRPVPGLFPHRNRIISGMADGILVVEAKEKSGTFITVDQGLEQGKEIFALPGRILDENSKGCNNLIKMGAHLVTDVSDILEILGEMGFSDGEKSDMENRIFNIDDVKNLLAPTEKMVYSVLSVEPKFIDDIIAEVMLAPGEVCMYLNRMEIMGIVFEPTRNFYSVRL